MKSGPDGRRASELRETHRETVARNRVKTSPLWARSCRAYNVQIEPGPRARAALAGLQRSLERAEPNLLVCPPETLHITVAWLLAVHAEYPEDKDVLWEHRGKEWVGELGRIAARTAGFGIAYGPVVATDTAVVALARPADPVNRLREEIQARLRLPPETRPGMNLVHTTLLRYRGPLSDPIGFLAALEDARVEAPVAVEELVVSRELVYPSLETEVLGRVALARR